TPQSLRMSTEQKYKEGDGPSQQMEASNRDELLIFTDKCQVYKTRASEFSDTKASLLGTYLPTELGMDTDEHVLFLHVPGDYNGNLLFFFANGKVARVETRAYETKTNRKKLTGAYSDASPIQTILPLREEIDIVVYSTEGRAILFNTSLLNPKSSRATQGVGLMTLKKAKYQLSEAKPLSETGIVGTARYRARSIPVAGAILKEEDLEEKQLGLLEE
ncbi:MAG: topoisomerase IV, partial [Oscillospiraceae bacterium]|nr:topoisomerase IV [Oscillospiraceae bacterium]